MALGESSRFQRSSYSIAMKTSECFRHLFGRLCLKKGKQVRSQAAHRALYAAGLDVLSYHRDVPPAQRADTLEAVARWAQGFRATPTRRSSHAVLMHHRDVPLLW